MKWDPVKNNTKQISFVVDPHEYGQSGETDNEMLCGARLPNLPPLVGADLLHTLCHSEGAEAGPSLPGRDELDKKEE